MNELTGHEFMKKNKFYPTIWFSGFFAAAVLVHIVRLAFGFSLVIAGSEISQGASLIVFKHDIL